MKIQKLKISKFQISKNRRKFLNFHEQHNSEDDRGIIITPPHHSDITLIAQLLICFIFCSPSIYTMFSGLIFSLETNLGVKQKKDVKALVEANGGKISDFVNTKVGSLFHSIIFSSALNLLSSPTSFFTYSL